MSASSGNAGASGTTTTSATVLSGAQASQLIARLREAQQQQQQGEGGGAQQTIKIQAVQTNPQTGVRQIIAIPISAVQGAGLGGSQGTAGKLTVSPLKSASGTSGQQQQVRFVKLSTANGAAFKTAVVGGASSNATPQVLTPAKQENALLSSPATLDGGSSGRKRADIDFESFSDSKRRKSEKGGKGLRHFSMKVCEKVQAKGSTSYNEVADELVAELTDPRCTSPTDQQYDQKNIRRRVYDALNVLMAMNIISKEKKEIRWLGLPTNSVQEANNLEVDKAKRMERIRGKTQQLQDLILQQIAFKNLVERNKEREKVEGPPAPNSAIQLPFIIVNTSKKTVIDCSISNDKMEYLFNFDNTFEIHDDMEVLKRMGLGFGLERGQVSPEDLAKAQAMVPKALEQYVLQLAENGPGSTFTGMPEVSAPIELKQEAVVDKSSDHEDESDVDIN